MCIDLIIFLSCSGNIILLMTSKQNVTYSLIFSLSDWEDYPTPPISESTQFPSTLTIPKRLLS